MKKIFILLIIGMIPLLSSAQSPAKAKAMLTLSFIRYIGWSDEAKKGDFVVGVVKDKDVAKYFVEQSTGKKFGYQDVVVKEFKSVDEIEDCQVLYVASSSNFNKNADKIVEKVGKDTLIVTETEGATNKGSMVNFVIRDDKLKFELCKKNASYAGIQFSAKLETMSAAINL